MVLHLVLHLPDFPYTATPLAAWVLISFLVLPVAHVAKNGGVAPLLGCENIRCNTYCNTHCNTHCNTLCNTLCNTFCLFKYRFHHLQNCGLLNTRGLIPGVCSISTSYYLCRSRSYNRQFVWACLHTPNLNF